MASIYDSILPQQTYISQNTPQYVSVFDGVLRPGQPANVGSPLSITSANQLKTAVITVNGTSGNTTLTSPGDVVLDTDDNITAICGPSGQVLLGNQTAVGGTTVSVAGPSGPGRVYDTIYNKPNPAPVPVETFQTGNTITHNTVQTFSFTIPSGVGTAKYILTMSGSNGFSDDTTPPHIPGNGVLQAWIQDAGVYSVAFSQASIAHAEFVVRPSATINTYLTGVIYNKSSGYMTLAPGTYNLRLAWWSNQDLVLGNVGNSFTLTLYRLG